MSPNQYNNLQDALYEAAEILAPDLLVKRELAMPNYVLPEDVSSWKIYTVNIPNIENIVLICATGPKEAIQWALRFSGLNETDPKTWAGCEVKEAKDFIEEAAYDEWSYSRGE